MFRRVKRAALALGAAGVVLGGFATPAAHAVPPPNGVKEKLALVGSDTTFDVMGAITHSYNTFSGNTDPDKVSNVPFLLPPGGSFTVKGDSHCGPVTYSNPGNPPPNGSTAGINALVADSTGCVDLARSSRGRSPSDPANIDFYAYAKDAVTWGRFGTACPGGDTGKPGCAPGNLTIDQLRGIYLCTQPGGQPLFTNWNQVGGDNGVIHRYLPQLGSGTLSFFQTKILGESSAQQNVLDSSSCATPPTRTEEHDATTIPPSEQPRAITPFSFAKWNQMAHGLISPDKRNGVKLAKINSVKPTLATIGNNTFFGTRYIYNVLKTTEPSYNATLDFAGVDATGNGFICGSNAVQSILTQYSEVPLAFAPAGPGLPNSFCRKNPTPL